MGAVTQIIKMIGDATDFNKEVAKAANTTEKAFSALTKELGGRFLKMAGAAYFIDKLIELGKESHQMAKNVSDMSNSLNISTEDVQRLGVVAGRTGVKIDQLHNAIAAVNELKAAAFQYDPEAMRKFATMGIDPKRSTMEIVHAMTQATGQAAIVVDNIFGLHSKRIKEAFKEMQNMGPIASQTNQEINALKLLGEQLSELWRIIVVAFTPLIVELNTVFQGFLDGAKSVLVLGAKLGSGNLKWKDIAQFGREQVDVALRMGVGRDTAYAKQAAVGKYKGTEEANPPARMPTYAPVDMAAKGGALNRIGLFVGGAPNIGDRLVTIGGFQLTQLRLIRGELERMNQQ